MGAARGPAVGAALALAGAGGGVCVWGIIWFFFSKSSRRQPLLGLWEFMSLIFSFGAMLR